MAGISLININQGTKTYGASLTDEIISKEFGLDGNDVLNLRIDLVVSAVTVTNAITVKLQNKAQGGAYLDLGSANAAVSVTANGTVSIILNKETAADLVDMPLRKSCRVVITTGVGDTVTIDEIRYQQR